LRFLVWIVADTIAVCADNLDSPLKDFESQFSKRGTMAFHQVNIIDFLLLKQEEKENGHHRFPGGHFLCFVAFRTASIDFCRW
jgi:hypothetical protein